MGTRTRRRRAHRGLLPAEALRVGLLRQPQPRQVGDRQPHRAVLRRRRAPSPFRRPCIAALACAALARCNGGRSAALVPGLRGSALARVGEPCRRGFAGCRLAQARQRGGAERGRRDRQPAGRAAHGEAAGRVGHAAGRGERRGRGRRRAELGGDARALRGRGALRPPPEAREARAARPGRRRVSLTLDLPARGPPAQARLALALSPQSNCVPARHCEARRPCGVSARQPGGQAGAHKWKQW